MVESSFILRKVKVLYCGLMYDPSKLYHVNLNIRIEMSQAVNESAWAKP
jgi:hypothetical protein